MYTRVGVMVLVQILHLVEARVYCQDSHASSWVPFGYTCPVLCQNIINAIERLKIMDFENIIYQKRPNTRQRKEENLKTEQAINDVETTGNDKDNAVFRAKPINKANDFENRIEMNKENDTTKTKNNTMDEKSFHKDVIKMSQLAAKTFRRGCKADKVDLVGIMKCARKANIDGSFLKIMTQLLNKYSHSKYKFTEDMTEVLLEKIFGENTDLRNNIFDVNKLLGFLRQALHRHKEHDNRDVIALSSRRCLSVSLPGCFCKSGFVESSGQCVRPSDCYQNPLYDEYISRLVIT